MARPIANKEKYVVAKENAMKLIAVCDRIINGESEASSCKNEGIKIGPFRRFVPTSFRDDISIPEITEWELTCAENLLKDIMGEIIPTPDDFDVAYEHCKKNYLREREGKVLDLYYMEELTLQEIGKILEITGERVRGIKEKALRRLRRPEARNALMFGMGFMARLEEINSHGVFKEMQLLQQEAQKRKEVQLEAEEIIQKEIESCGHIDSIKGIWVPDLPLSVRLQNVLKRANIRTLGDLLEYSYEDLKNIRNMGRVCLEELIEYLHDEYGIVIGSDSKR